MLEQKILSGIKENPADIQGYKDLFSLCCSLDDLDYALKLNSKLRSLVISAMDNDVVSFFTLYKRTLLFAAPHCLDSYLLYLEIDRLPKDRFYQPRRKVLRCVVNELQKLADDELDELFFSMPPRVGKTTLLLLFVTWLIGRDSERANLYSAYSATITSSFYSGVLEIIKDEVTYLWKDVFPEAKISQTNAFDATLNIDRKKRYPTLTCRSLYGTLNGACDCNGYLISDDLIGGIEEALNVDRLRGAWSKVDNNLIPRAKETAKITWCGTRWSMFDPIGLRMELLENDERYKSIRYKIINLPALDENDESNFDFPYGLGFSTDYYHRRRASFERNNDMASWCAQYMGDPIEREGALFTPEDFRYYNGELPEGEPDRIFCAVDPAFGGGDFVAAPVCYQYGDDIYVHDVVYDDGDKRVTQPLLIKAILDHSIQAMQIEANKSTESYKDGIAEGLGDYRLNLTTKSAPSNKGKHERIFDKAPDIREYMIFRESGKRNKPYSLFMQNVLSFKMFGKNKNDDAPDSLSMAMEMARLKTAKVEAFKRFI